MLTVILGSSFSHPHMWLAQHSHYIQNLTSLITVTATTLVRPTVTSY